MRRTEEIRDAWAIIKDRIGDVAAVREWSYLAVSSDDVKRVQQDILDVYARLRAMESLYG